MALAKKRFTHEVGGKTLTLEVSALAEQANGAVLATYGGTTVLATAVMTDVEAKADYLPLKVDYEEKFYAAGKILGSRYVRREGRPSEEAILSGRLVDRTVRPLFDQRIRREIQVVVTVVAYDEAHDPDFPGLVAASTALGISDIPWNGPAAGVRIAKIGNDLAVNPTNSEMRGGKAPFTAFVAGPEGLINMIEFEGNEIGEDEVARAFARGQEEINALIAFQRNVIKEIGRPKADVTLFEPDAKLRAAIESFLVPRLDEAVYVANKMEQENRLRALKRALFAHLAESGVAHDAVTVEFVFEGVVDGLVHKNILEHGRRPDGRAIDEVRALEGEVGLFDRTHGSALFVRGNTQALAVTTLAPPGQEQVVESMEGTGKRRFMLHYNFPPYSVGETGSFRGPGRREIGHGALAEKALRPLLPTSEEFPYTIRVVSEILSSNGSSSMATVCASVMSLMDAGVPLRRPAAGIAMGLMMEEEDGGKRIEDRKFKVLTDLQGPEDHYGDMDFKVAGTEAGVNAVQLDVKVNGLTMEIVKQTLVQAKAARLQILDFIKTVIAAPKESLSKYVPVIIQLKINPDRIGMVIGPGGKTINGMIKRYDLASIDIEEDGSVFISAADPVRAKEAATEIKMMTREFKIGEIIEGRVLKTLEFGAIVDLGGGKDGMVHVSELKNEYVKNVTDVVRAGDFVRAKVIRADEDGRIGLSIKQAKEE